MDNKSIRTWKSQFPDNKVLSVASNVRSIDPIVNNIVMNLLSIDVIQYARITKSDILASNVILKKGRMQIPASTPGHPSAIGVHLIIDFDCKIVQFFEITSAVKGYGEQIVQAVVTSIPDDWKVIVVLDWSGGFWQKMSIKYNNIEIC